MSKPIIHLAAPANPADAMLRSLKFNSTKELVAAARAALGPRYRVRAKSKLVEANLDEQNGGRSDDRARIDELQSVIEDERVVALVALKGGGWLTRIIPHLDFAPLHKRKTPLAVFGFSEITPLVNLIGLRRRGFGFYYMTPGYPVTAMERYARQNIRKLRQTPMSSKAVGAFAKRWAQKQGREQFDAYFRELASVLEGGAPGRAVTGKLVSGSLPDESSATFIGGCLSLVTPLTVAAYAKQIKPDGKWIVLEDLGEAPHRIDRQFAHLKLAGWFEKCAGVLVGDFHMGGRDQAAETLAILDYHLPTQRSMPVVQTNLVGHTWPQAMLPVGRALTMRCQPGRGRHKDVTITWPTDRLRVVGA
ncbi:MAG: LD-carboxypeptidase [Phycisphaerales bacterium]|nr:LD-carboxypeptidase [Phycisphaerales bacterium]